MEKRESERLLLKIYIFRDLPGIMTYWDKVLYQHENISLIFINLYSISNYQREWNKHFRKRTQGNFMVRLTRMNYVLYYFAIYIYLERERERDLEYLEIELKFFLRSQVLFLSILIDILSTYLYVPIYEYICIRTQIYRHILFYCIVLG